ncbi:unnamed protein product [Cylindrotheca closterium]|uniref:Formate/nitrite transporter n=1 Tax=Cylindrotheca closterium TaxID=2856 RepID=A0AAD2PUF2_9STRA|nr:unnamed protein product [Cylindrotheca closterium]
MTRTSEQSSTTPPTEHSSMVVGSDGTVLKRDCDDEGEVLHENVSNVQKLFRRMSSSNVSGDLERGVPRQRKLHKMLASRGHSQPQTVERQESMKKIVQQVTLNYSPTKSGKDTLEAVYKTGEYKAALPLNILVVQSFMAGIYIAMAGHLYLAVGGGALGAAMFPTGLIAVILTSAELFTGDSLVFVASVLGKRVAFSKLLRNWTVSWIMNFAGCLFWAYLLAYASDSLESLDKIDFAIAVALKKTKPSWGCILLKGIAANFMVCVGVWQAACAEEVAGKILCLWFPITAFVLMGFDHCIANQFLIPLGMMLGADISIKKLLLEALLPATLGNIVGGGLLVGGIYWYVFDSKMKNKLRLPVVRKQESSQSNGKPAASKDTNSTDTMDRNHKPSTHLEEEEQDI